ncbi:hypothetical protein LQK93_00411 [Terrabacter sp. BE26]
MRRKRPVEVQCPAELARFDPSDWGGATFQTWQSWLHARADFADHEHVDHDAIPYEVSPSAWQQILQSTAPTTLRGATASSGSTPTMAG